MFKIISAILLSCFFFTRICFAQEAETVLSTQPTLEEIIQTLPNISDSFAGGENEIILCLASFSQNVKNQQSIADTLNTIKNLLPISTVISEQEFYDFNNSFVFPDKEIVTQLSDYLLQKNMITGLEYFSIFNNQLQLVNLANNISLKAHQATYEKIKNNIPQTKELIATLKTEIEDVESYLMLELNLPPMRLDFLRNKFQEYYTHLSFWDNYLSLTFTPEEFLSYETNRETHSLEAIVVEIQSILNSLSVSLKTSFNLQNINDQITEFEDFRTIIFNHKNNLAENIMQTVKNKKEKYIVFIMEPKNQEIIFKELKRRSVSYVLIESEKNNGPNTNSLDTINLFPELSKFETLIDELITNWTKEKNTYFLNKRSVFLIENLSLFFYKILKIYKSKDQLNTNLREVITLVEQENKLTFEEKKKSLKHKLEKELMTKTEKDYLTIKEMNDVNLAVSNESEKATSLAEKIEIDIEKIKLSPQGEVLIPFKLIFREKEISNIIFIAEKIKISISDLKYLIEKDNISEKLAYKIIYAEGIDSFGEYSRLAQTYKDTKALEKADKVLEKIKAETQANEAKDLLTAEEKSLLLISSRNLSHKVAEKHAGQITYTFDKLYEAGREEIEKIFAIYDKLNFSKQDILHLATTINSKLRDTFIFYLNSGLRVELNKEIAKLYIAHTLKKQTSPEILNLIYSLDSAIADGNEKELTFLKPMTKQALNSITDIEDIQRIFYLTLFSDPLFEDSKPRLSYKEKNEDLFAMVETKLLFFQLIFYNPILTVTQVEELISAISDTLIYAYRELKKKEHREIFEWEKEKLYKLERILLLMTHMQFTINTLRTFAGAEKNINSEQFKQLKENYINQSKKEETAFLKDILNNTEENPIIIHFPKCKLWKQLQLSKELISDFIRYYFQKITIKTRMYAYPSFESLFNPEILTSKWYKELEKTDILSRLAMELIVKPQNIHPLADDLYLFDSATVAARFLLKYDKNKRLEKVFIERLGQNPAETLFIEFTKDFVTNPFDQRIVEDINAKFLLSVGNLNTLMDKETINEKKPDNILLLRPLCSDKTITEQLKSLVNNHPLIKYLMFKCKKLEKERPLSLGNHIYILRELADTEQRINKTFYLPSNSFLQTDKITDTPALIAHEAIHYIFYNLKENLNLLNNLTYFFKTEKYEKFYSRVLKIVGLDIKIDQELYFKAELKDSINYRKLEELFALIAETLLCEKEIIRVDILNEDAIELPLYTEDIEMLVLADFLPFWMSPVRLNYSNPTITAAYYDLSFNYYLNFLIEKSPEEELKNFLTFWTNNYQVNPERSLTLLKGFLKINDSVKANEQMSAILENKLTINQAINTAKQAIFKNLFLNYLTDLSNQQKIDFLQNLNQHIAKIEQLANELNLSPTKSLSYQFIVGFYLSQNFCLPARELIINFNNLIYPLEELSTQPKFFDFIKIYTLFWQETNTAAVSKIMNNYTIYQKSILCLQKIIKMAINNSFYCTLVQTQKKAWLDYSFQNLPSLDEILFGESQYRTFAKFALKKSFNLFINFNKIQR